MSKLWNTNGEPGCILHSKSTLTKSRVALYKADQAGLEPPDPSHKYVLRCIEHDLCISFKGQRPGRDNMKCPDIWCPKCGGLSYDQVAWDFQTHKTGTPLVAADHSLSVFPTITTTVKTVQAVKKAGRVVIPLVEGFAPYVEVDETVHVEGTTPPAKEKPKRGGQQRAEPPLPSVKTNWSNNNSEPIEHPLWVEARLQESQRPERRCSCCRKPTRRRWSLIPKRAILHRYYNDHPLKGPNVDAFCSKACAKEMNQDSSKIEEVKGGGK